MLIAVGCVTLLALASLILNGYLLCVQREERAQTAVERRELLERIQRPERLPASVASEPAELPEEVAELMAHEAREWARVGEIEISDTYGLSDEDG